MASSFLVKMMFKRISGIECGPQRKPGFRQIICLFCLLGFWLNPCVLRAQNFDRGFVPFESYQSSGLDSVNLADGNLLLHIPVISYPQKGSLPPFTLSLRYNNPRWVIDYFVFQGTNGIVYDAYWRHNGSSIMIVRDDAYSLPIYNYTDPNTGYATSSIHAVDSSGAHHVLETIGDPNNPNGPRESIDGTGLRLNGGGLIDSEGITHQPQAIDPTVTFENGFGETTHDPHGNAITPQFDSWSRVSGWIDSVGRAIPATHQPLALNGSPASFCETLNFPVVNGATAPMTFCYTNLVLQSPFSVPWADFFGQGHSTWLTSISLPNGTAWYFGYNSFGELSTITLPTGGVISYTWKNSVTCNQTLNNPAMPNNPNWTSDRPVTCDRVVATRIFNANDGTPATIWRYSYPSNGTLPVTVTDPAGNDTLHTFGWSYTGSPYEVTTQYYSGASANNNLLKRIDRQFQNLDYNFDLCAGYDEVADNVLRGAAVVPLSTTTSWPNGQVSQTTFTYDSGASFKVSDSTGQIQYTCPLIYGKLIQQSDYDYGSGAPGPLLRQTVYQYQWQGNSSYLTANLLDTPCVVTVYGPGSVPQPAGCTPSSSQANQLAQTIYGYDENNGSPQGVFGNQTSVTHRLNGGTSPKSQTVFNAQGMPTQKIDPKGNTTTITYDSTGMFPNQTQYPDTSGIHHVESFVYDANTGLLTSHTGQNGEITSYSYDNMRRLTGITYPPGGGSETYAYNDSTANPQFTFTRSITSSLNFVEVGKVDGFGRKVQSQVTSDLAGTDFVDVTYDPLGQVATASNPYRTTTDSTYGLTQTQYDALGRVTQVTKQDGSFSTISYSGNCVTSTDEAGNARKSCSDGLGRLIEVDEPNVLGNSATASITVSGGLATTPVSGSNPPLPASGSPLASFVASDGSSTQVLFLGSNQFLYDVLWNTTGGWQDIEVSAVGGDVPAASSSLLSAVTQSSGPEHIFFEGANQHIYDLSYHSGSGWRTQDLNAATGAASAMTGSPLASSAPGSGALAGNVYTFYVGANQHIYTQYWNSANSSWQSADMTALTGATPAAGSKLSVSYRADSTLDVFYEASNQHIYDMSWTTTNGWQNQDLTAITGNTLAATGAAMTSDGGVNGNPVHLYYSGTNQHIYCLYWNSQTAAWANADLTATTGGAVAASGSSLSEANLLDGTTHIFYEGANQHIYQLFCCTSSWQSQDLTAGTGNTLAATGTALTSFAPAGGPVSGNGYVVYLGTNQHVYTIFWNQSSWQNADLTSISANIAIDSGTVSLNVGGFVATACYGPTTNTSCSGQAENITSSDVASALAQALNVPTSPATASASGSTINMTWKTPGAYTPSVGALSTTHDQPALFSNPSFTSPATSFSGGSGPALGISEYVTLYSYDALGNLLSVNQKGDGSQPARIRTFTYDSLSRLLTANNPESGTISYSYDPNGNLLQKTSPAPNQTGSATQTISYCYDALNRVTGKAYSAQTCTNGQLPQGTAVVSYAYDAGTNGIGHLSSLTDQAGSGSYGYDVLGRISTEQRTISGISKTLSYTYNLDGSVATLKYPSGAVITYTPDAVGRMVSAVDVGNNVNYVTGTTYGPDNALTAFISGNSTSFAGITNSFTYNKRLQPVNMSATTPTQTVFSIGYDFHLGAGDNGNVFAIANNKDTTRNQTFTYDTLNRLTSAYNAGADCGVILPDNNHKFWGNTYTYDAWGNLTNKTPLPNHCAGENLNAPSTVKNQIQSSTNCYDASGNLITTTTYCYDAAGNLRTDGSGRIYAYDAENRITGAGGYTYIYDADGNRVEKTTGGTSPTGTLYWYMSPGIVAESDLTNALKSEYVFFDGERVARKDFSGGAVSYYFSDHLKTTDIVTDAQGNIKNESDFYPWGGELQFAANDSNHYKFTGKERDTETGLDYFGARYYSNGLGRFITPDWAAKATAVPYADFDDPQSLNLYGYVRNVPSSRLDPDGHCCWDEFKNWWKYGHWMKDEKKAKELGQKDKEWADQWWKENGQAAITATSLSIGFYGLYFEAMAPTGSSASGVEIAEVEAGTYNISTAGMTSEERSAVIEYAQRTNAWLKENGPATIKSTAGTLRAEANAAARAERLDAARAGQPYTGQAGHVPDTAISGSAKPPAGWLDMPGKSNSVVGGGLASRIGQMIKQITVDGKTP